MNSCLRLRYCRIFLVHIRTIQPLLAIWKPILDTRHFHFFSFNYEFLISGFFSSSFRVYLVVINGLLSLTFLITLIYISIIKLISPIEFRYFYFSNFCIRISEVQIFFHDHLWAFVLIVWLLKVRLAWDLNLEHIVCYKLRLYFLHIRCLEYVILSVPGSEFYLTLLNAFITHILVLYFISVLNESWHTGTMSTNGILRRDI